VGVGAVVTALFAFWAAHASEFLAAIERHIALAGASTVVAVAIGVPVAILAVARPRLGKPALAAVSIAQTIPSLALLGFLLPLPFVGGVGPRVAVVALVIYALLPIVRGTVAGLTSIDRAVLDAADAMGMTRGQRFRLIELPLALPSIVAGIRVATIIGIGTATIAAAIGAGGLGEYIFRGLSMVDSTVILAGAVPAAVLAVVADALLTWAERALSVSRRRRPAAAAAVLVAIVAAIVVGAATARAGGAVVIGSKNFTEQIILGELLAQTLEGAGVPVTRRLNLGGTFICDRAVRAGDIDAYVEYTGTALTAIFKQPVVHDPAAVLDRVRDAYARGGIAVLPPLGFNNTFAILVRQADADALGLRRIGDLSRMASTWTPGFGYEFVERADGYRGLAAAYDLQFAHEPRVMDLTLMYRGLASGQVDVVAGDATSGLIPALHLAALEDDRHYFPPYYAVPVVRSDVLLRFPRARTALAALAGRVSDADMRALNHAVDVEHQDPAAVVRRFMERRHLSPLPPSSSP
jgi:osmoprotectant transport system permease protein